MKISVLGLGYVGCVTSACLAKQGHIVTGVDINTLKIDRINRGEAPFVEPDLDALIQESKNAGRLKATLNAEEAIQTTEISLICVGTPSKKNQDLDLTFVKNATESIGRVLRDKKSRHIVVVRSTVLPGSTERVVIPALEANSGKNIHQGFGVCYNPEFLREGTAVNDFFNPPKTIIGEICEEDGDALHNLYKNIKAPLFRTSIPHAEMAKYVDNVFHALKIVFANEIGRISKSHNLDSHEVMNVFCRDTKLNLSRAYLRPGFAFGGSCLPKDLRAIVYRAKQKDLNVPLLKAIQESNQQQIQLAIERIQDTGKRKIGFLGLSFKAETDDLRESPLVQVVETFLGKGYQVKIYDGNVSLARIHGTNKEYMDTHLPHLASLLTESVDEIIRDADVIVLGNQSKAYNRALQSARPEQIIIDLVRIVQHPKTKGTYEGLSW